MESNKNLKKEIPHPALFVVIAVSLALFLIHALAALESGGGIIQVMGLDSLWAFNTLALLAASTTVFQREFIRGYEESRAKRLKGD